MITVNVMATQSVSVDGIIACVYCVDLLIPLFVRVSELDQNCMTLSRTKKNGHLLTFTLTSHDISMKVLVHAGPISVRPDCLNHDMNL